MSNLCRDCPANGCGAYHDICPMYAEYKKQREAEKRDLKDKNRTYRAYISAKSLRTPKALKRTSKRGE